MKIVISIFALPYEIDELDAIIRELKKASHFLKLGYEWTIDVTLCVSDDIVDWKRSGLPRSYFVERLHNISGYADWCRARFRVSEDVLGCVSQRRRSYVAYPDADYHIWLDTDIVFGQSMLAAIESAIAKFLDDSPPIVLTPEIVRIWDETWDCLVNERYRGMPLNYQRTNDPYVDCGVKGEMSLELVSNSIPGQPRMKFAGGWFTCLSTTLLQLTGIPESLGHYGYEDTYIMWAAESFNQSGNYDIKQFKIRNLVVCENYKYRNNSYLANHLSIFDRKKEFRDLAEQGFRSELATIRKRLG